MLDMNLCHIPATFFRLWHNSKRLQWLQWLQWLRAASMALLLLGMPACATVRVKSTASSFHTVVIDAGHGGSDTGTRSRLCTEKSAALDVALKVDARLRSAGFHTVLTRKGDYFIELNDRARVSNRQRNAVFVSIHFNESSRRSIAGTEIYYKSGVSLPLAQRILNNICSQTGSARRGVRTANFRVLKLNEYPAVLVECGYMSNRSEARRCASADYRSRLAAAIADGLIEQRYGSRGAKLKAES